MYKYHCKECDVEVFMDMVEADYCPNCGSNHIDEYPLSNEDKSHLKVLIDSEK